MADVKRDRDRIREIAHGAGFCFGAHLSIAGGVHHAITEALRLRFDTVQVFVRNQRQWRAAAMAPDDVERWLDLRQTPGFGPPVAHAGYLINLASPDRALRARSRQALVEEVRRCDVLAIPDLVLHPGSATDGDRACGLVTVAEALNRVFDERPASAVRILLETTAGQGSTLGRSFEELAAILALVQEPRRVGVCADTCHLFAAGYDFRSPAGYATMLAEVQRSVGVERIRCWHLNDSRGECGSHLDRHEHIGRGRLGRSGFRQILGDGRFRGLPMILETPKGVDPAGRELDSLNLRRLRTMARRYNAPA